MSEVPESPKLPWYAGPRAFARALLQLDDTPHRIALGAAIGMWISLTPTHSVQMLSVLVLAAATARFVRFNVTAGLVMCYVSNPLTIVPIHYACYKLGSLFVPGEMTYERLKEVITGSATQGFADSLALVWHEIGWPFVLGTLIASTVSSLVTYPVVHWLVRKYRGGDPVAAAATTAPVTAR